jgi:hypothetical protein
MDYVGCVLRSARRGIIFDTNVLLVYLVGLWNPAAIGDFKKTSGYTLNDFELLCRLASAGRKFVITPHCLTEVCNHTDVLNRKYRSNFFQFLRDLIQHLSERRPESKVVAKTLPFENLGLADATLVDASQKSYAIVTDELGCFLAISRVHGLCINLNHLRSSQWLS